MNYSVNEIRKFLDQISDEDFRKRVAEAGVIIITKDMFTPEEWDNIKPTTESDDEIERKVSSLLRDMGFKTNLKGYYYIPKAVSIICKSTIPCDVSMTKTVYPMVSKAFGTTNSRVERAMRHSLECAFETGEKELIDKVFSCSVSPLKGKPTNSEFLFRLAEYISEEE